MTHGGRQSATPTADDFDEQPTQLRWIERGPWEWALGHYGTVRGFDGPPWIVEIDGWPRKTFRTLTAARRALEDAAIAEAYEIVHDADE